LFVHTMQTQPMGEWFSQGKEYIDETANYHQYTLEYFDTENTINSEIMSPKQLMIFVPAQIVAAQTTDTLITTTSGIYNTETVNVNPRTTLESTLGAWLKSCVTSGFSSIQVKGDVTGTAPSWTLFVN